MKVEGNTILITGGSSGIGLALAEAFSQAGNQVLICGRNEIKLEEAKSKLPQLHVRVCDVSKQSDREDLFQWATSGFPDLNILINNAGIQRETDFSKGAPELTDGESEIDTNLTANIHLSALFVPHFLKQPRECAIVNITSGLAFIPLKIIPVYCATKAAIHSFSMSLRSQLAEKNVRVFEIIPPIVQTELHRGAEARKQGQKGIAPFKVATATLRAMQKDRYEVPVGQGRDLMFASRIAPHFFHKLLNKLVSK